MQLEISQVQQQLDEAVSILDLQLVHLLSRKKSTIKPELRAISLADLRRVVKFVLDKCAAYGWVDERSKAVVSDPRKIDWYHLVYNFVGPVTAPAGHEVVDDSIRIGTDHEAPGGEADWFQHQGRRRLRYVRGFPPSPEVGKPDKFVRTFSGSFAELLWKDSRSAEWFVSHYWGEPLVDFATSLDGHDQAYRLEGVGLYWVSAFANSQTHIGEELGTQGMLCSPLFRALQLSQAAVLVIDAASEVTRRMWCMLESVVATRHGKELLLVTADGGAGHVLTSDPAPADTPLPCPSPCDYAMEFVMPEQVQRNRQALFPAERLNAAATTNLESASVSNRNDAKMIIEVVHKELGGFERVNSDLRVLGAAAMFKLGKVTPDSVLAFNEAAEPFALTGDGCTFQKAKSMGLELRQCSGVTFSCKKIEDAGVQVLAQGLVQASKLSIVVLDFSCCTQVGDAGVEALGSGLGHAPSLSSVVLDFSCCERIGDAAVQAVGQGLGQAPNLSSLVLRFSHCQGIGDAGIQAVGQALGQASILSSVVLDVVSCMQIGDAGIQALAHGLAQAPSLITVELIAVSCERLGDTSMQAVCQALGQAPNLSSLILKSACCERIGDAGLQGLGPFFAQTPTLKSIELDFAFCPRIGDAGLQALAQGLGNAPNLSSVQLSFSSCERIGDAGVEALGQGLGDANGLRLVVMSFDGCELVGDAGMQALAQGLGKSSNLSIQDFDGMSTRHVFATGGMLSISSGDVVPMLEGLDAVIPDTGPGDQMERLTPEHQLGMGTGPDEQDVAPDVELSLSTGNVVSAVVVLDAVISANGPEDQRQRQTQGHQAGTGTGPDVQDVAPEIQLPQEWPELDVQDVVPEIAPRQVSGRGAQRSSWCLPFCRRRQG